MSFNLLANLNNLCRSANSNLLLYDSAVAAYSLRKLTQKYNGVPIRVRRDSDNLEQDIGFNSGELDIAQLASFCGASNGFVATWYDQSGNGHNLNQNTLNDQPKIYDLANGLITENSLPAIDFNGSSDFLESSSPVITTDDTIFLVAAFTGNIFDSVNDLPPNPTISGHTIIGNSGSFRTYLSGETIYDTYNANQNLHYILKSSVNSKASINNNPETSIGARTSTLNGIRLGKARASYGSSASGTIQEIIVFDSDQSANKAVLQGNINSYYGVFLGP